jgi:hypothetical protein
VTTLIKTCRSERKAEDNRQVVTNADQLLAPSLSTLRSHFVTICHHYFCVFMTAISILEIWAHKNHRNLAWEKSESLCKIIECVGLRAHWRRCCRFFWFLPLSRLGLATCLAPRAKRIPTVTRRLQQAKTPRQCPCLLVWIWGLTKAKAPAPWGLIRPRVPRPVIPCLCPHSRKWPPGALNELRSLRREQALCTIIRRACPLAPMRRAVSFQPPRPLQEEITLSLILCIAKQVAFPVL